MKTTRDAFTLLEILIVLAILGMGLALISTMTRTTARYSERVEEDTTVQLACENLMNSILAGSSVALIGVETPIPDAPNWSTTVELLDGPLPNLVAIRILARRYLIEEVPSTVEPGGVATIRTLDVERTFMLKEWARRAEIKTRVVQTKSDGSVAATDGTGETVWKDLGPENDSSNPFGGGIGMGTPPDATNPFGEGTGGAAANDPFAAVNAANGFDIMGAQPPLPGAQPSANPLDAMFPQPSPAPGGAF